MRGYLQIILKLSVACFALAAFVSCQSSPCGSDKDDKYSCLPIGKPKRFNITGFDNSINGYARLDAIQAVLVLDGSKQKIPLRAKEFHQPEWGNEIFVPGLSVGGVSVTKIQKLLTVHVEVEAPANTSLVGQTGTIEFLFDITYPKLDQEDDVIVRSLCNSKLGKRYENCMTWSDRHQRFPDKQAVMITSSQ